MRLDETRRDNRRDETRQDKTRETKRRDETREKRHFRNCIFRPSERRRIMLRKQYTLDPRLSWTLTGGQNHLEADNETSYHVVDFRPGITTSHYSTLWRNENVILQGLLDNGVTIVQQWSQLPWSGGFQAAIIMSSKTMMPWSEGLINLEASHFHFATMWHETNHPGLLPKMLVVIPCLKSSTTG